MSSRDRLLALLADGKVVRPRDLSRAQGGGIPRMTLFRLHKEGLVVKEDGVGFRLAQVAEADPLPSGFQQAALLASRHPGGVLCYFSALKLNAEIHGRDADLTDQFTGMDTVAVPQSRALNQRSLHGTQVLTWPQGRHFTVGVDEMTAFGVRIRFTNPERTIVDLFRPMLKADVRPPGQSFGALMALAGKRGIASVQLVENYAAELGLLREVGPSIVAAKGVLACAPRTP